MEKILVTGALGQIGSELVPYLMEKYGKDNVIASDIKDKPNNTNIIYEKMDCKHPEQINAIIKRHNVKIIYHLAAILSFYAEQNPQLAWQVNVGGLFNMLEASREYKCKIFTPSSIAAFGPLTPKDNTPQDTIQRPNKMYGITKVSGEMLCDYYYERFQVDTRGLRYPGIISYVAPPGGGTTDYAVEIFYEAIKNKKYSCFLDKNTALDMMYMPDALKAAVDLMEADNDKLKHRNAFNVTAMSITPEKLSLEIKKHIPEFEINYKVDKIRQEIADSWPNHLDDKVARDEWNWSPCWNLENMTKDMIEKLNAKL